MPDNEQSFKVICKGGLNSSQNFLELADLNPGYATRLVNFETSLTGGYRRIAGFTPYDVDFAEVTSVADPAEGAVLGVWGFHNSNTGDFEIMAARKLVGSAAYRYYLYDTVTGWGAITTGVTHNSTGVSRIRAEVFNFGTDNIIIFVDGVNKALAFDGTTWYELDSANSGGSGSPGGDQLVNAPSVIASFKDHVFLAGDPSAPGVVVFSAPSDYLTWTAAAGSGQQIANFKVKQIKPFRDELFVFGETHIKKSLPDAASGFIFQDVTNNLGCIATDSVFELAGNLVFLSNDGLRIVAGTAKIGDVELTTISDEIQNTLANAGSTYNYDHLKAVVIRKKTQFRYFIGDGNTETTSSFGLIGSLRVRREEGATWEFGELLGIRASCVWSGYGLANTEYILHGDYNGKVYQQEMGNDFDSENIISIYTTPYYHFGDTEVRKTMKKINIFTKATSSFSISIAVAVKYDFDDMNAVNPTNYTVSADDSAVIYDAGFTYDSGVEYVGSTQPIFKTNIQGSGMASQFSFVSDGVYAPFTIQGFVIEYTLQGRQ